ncbi:MAG: AI-2E family transporter [Alphaproteobacteria bacterium]|nr:AI-2E family transporter [Alphaproteobacteria bacterium]
MTARAQIAFWVVTLAVFVTLLVLLRDILLPFVAGMAVAYFLDPAADRLERWGLSRTLATTLLTVGFCLVVVLGLMVLVPLLIQQIESLARNLPGYIDLARDNLMRWSESLRAVLSPADLDRVRNALGGAGGKLLAWLLDALGGVLRSGQAVLNLLSLVVITPVVSFYLLRDLNRLTTRLDGYLPRDHAAEIRTQLRLIDRTLSGFARGQASVCLILAAFYGIGLSLVGLQFGLVVGIAAGLISFVPFVGSIGGLIVSVGLALLQFDETWRIVAVAAVFFAGQAAEGNVLTPKLVGDRVGLHAVWVMFALLAGGALFGFVGLLIAVPTAAVIGVMVRFFVDKYLASRLYRGEDSEAP